MSIPNQLRFQYRYQPLPPIAETGRTPPFSRLLLLHAGAHDDPLHGSLTIANMENPPVYEALSYTWGKEDSRTCLYIDGQPLPIKPNLEAALRQYRLQVQSRRLWVDALCIDQSSTSERSRQVSYMREVYKNCVRVVVWLGPRCPGDEHAFFLAERIAELRRAMSTQGDATHHFDDIEEDTKRAIFDAVLEDCHPNAMHFLATLLDRQYFYRSWCVQEVVVPPHAVARSGDLEIPFYDLLAACTDVGQYHASEARASFIGKTLGFWNALHVKRNAATSEPQAVKGSFGPLLSLLATTREFQATDPRDKVFALLGISDEGLEPIRALTQVMGQNNGGRLEVLRNVITRGQKFMNSLGPDIDFARPQALKPDYDKGVIAVYRDLARFMIRKSPRVLDILVFVQHREDPDVTSCPSWVPKWNESQHCAVIGWSHFQAGFCDGRFRYFADVHDNPLSGRSVNPGILSLDGFVVDTVQRVSDVMSFEMLNDDMPMEPIWNQLFFCPMELQTGQRYHDNEFLLMAFCRTLIASFHGHVIDVAMGLRKLSPEERSLGKTLPVTEAMADIAQYLIEHGDRFGVASELVTLLGGITAGGDMWRFIKGRGACSENRRMFLTQNGTLGLGPSTLRPGDMVTVFFGGRTPFVLRPISQEHHVLLGNCYVHDDAIMWGKATEDVKVHRTRGPVVTFNIR